MKATLKSTVLCIASASIFSVASVSQARVDVSVMIGVPPPVAVVETVPPPRAGYVYAPGYWGWDGHRHVWIRGRTIVERPGYTWVADRWEPDGGRYRFVPGYWEPVRSHPGKGYAKGHGKGKHKGHD